MDWYLVSVLVFSALLAVWVYRDRKKFTRESVFLLRRTQHGKRVLEWLGTRFPRFWKVVGFVSVLVGFGVSVLGTKMLIDNLMASIASKSASPGLALVLPSPTAEPVFGYGYLAVPFWYWIICIGLLALVHEGFHGIFTAREKTRIKSMGFGLLAIIPLAFVEPDEKQLSKKGVWPQLRVFSAGSFANFILAAFSIFLMLLIANNVYNAAGVDFQTYPYAKIPIASITSVGGHAVGGTDDIVSVLQDFGENETLETDTANATYFIKRRLLDKQLSDGVPQDVMLFQDYPAARAGIEGTIVKVGDMEIDDPADLSLALEAVGPGSTADITLRSGGSLETVAVGTVEMPEAAPYSPDSAMLIFAALENVVPGSIDFYISSGGYIASLSGQDTSMTWAYLRNEIGLWQWVADTYPALSARASEKVSSLQAELSGRNEPGFIGILNVTPHYEIVASLAPFSDAFDFIQGLLAFLFLINFGVGIVNLLPLKPLDGGKMWEIALNRYVPAYAPRIMKVLAYFILFLFIANFIPIGLLF